MKHQTIRPIDQLVSDLLNLQPEVTTQREEPLPQRAEHLSDDHPLKQQAFLVLDALESVTNGMENPDVFVKLDTIPPSSSFAPWVSLIYAIQAFYRNSPKDVLSELSSIPRESAPYRLVPLLLTLSGNTPAQLPARKIEKQILEQVENTGGILIETMEQAGQAIADGQTEIFSDSIAFLIKELTGTYPDISRKTALWALQTLKTRDADMDIFEDNLRLIFGDLETSRLKALSLMELSPREAFTSWVYYTVLLLEENLRSEEEIEASFSIGALLYEAVRPLEEGYSLFLEGLYTDLRFLLEEHYPSLAERSENCTDVGGIFTCLGNETSPLESSGYLPLKTIPTAVPKKVRTVQLELIF